MRFIDANVVVYAVLKPKAALAPAVAKKKAAARDIFLRVNDGEPVVTTTLHLSEVANVLEDVAGLAFATDLLSAVLFKPSIEVETVSADDYRESVTRATKYGISVNDALALVVMDRRSVDEIYTFDRHFEQTPVAIADECR